MSKLFNGRVGGIFVLLPIFFIFIFTFNLVDAKTIAATEKGSLEILTASWDSVPQNEPLDIYWHVFNGTKYKTNLTTTCYFHLYSINEGGKHIMVLNPAKTFSNNRDFEAEINANNFSNTGDYRAVIECNSSSEVGGKVIDFVVTPQGNGVDLGNFFWLIIVFSYGIVIFGTWKEDMIITMLGTFALFFLGLYMLFYGIDIYKNSMTEAFAWVTLSIAMYVSFRVGLDMMNAK